MSPHRTQRGHSCSQHGATSHERRYSSRSRMHARRYDLNAMQRGSKNDTAANSVIVEYGDWNSHKLTSWVTTILLREKLGYRTAMVLLAVLLPHARRSLARYSWRIVMPVL